MYLSAELNNWYITGNVHVYLLLLENGQLFNENSFSNKINCLNGINQLPTKLIKIWMIFLKTKTEDVAVKGEVAFDGERDLDDLEDFRIFDIRPSQHGEASNIVGFWWRENRELHFLGLLK